MIRSQRLTLCSGTYHAAGLLGEFALSPAVDTPRFPEIMFRAGIQGPPAGPYIGASIGALLFSSLALFCVCQTIVFVFLAMICNNCFPMGLVIFPRKRFSRYSFFFFQAVHPLCFSIERNNALVYMVPAAGAMRRPVQLCFRVVRTQAPSTGVRSEPLHQRHWPQDEVPCPIAAQTSNHEPHSHGIQGDHVACPDIHTEGAHAFRHVSA